MDKDMSMEINLGTSLDAEVQAIRGIPQVLQNLNPKRKIGVLKYLIERVESGDYFGED